MPGPRQAKDPRARQRARTRSAIMDAASEVIRERGDVPSVAEAAEAAEVGRTTAYRYFPTQGALLWALVQAVVPSLGDVEFTSDDDPVVRADDVVSATFDRVREIEPVMRAQLRLAMEQWALKRAGRLTEEPIPRGGRKPVIEAALAPLEGWMDQARLRRLNAAIGAIGAIEGRIVFRDIYALGEREAYETARWATRALVQQAIADEEAERGKR